MAQGASFKWDPREFTETLRRYATISKKDPAEICNRKALRIQIKASKKTPKATKAQIREDLLKIGDHGAPIAAMMINKARKAAGLPGLFGRQMRDAVTALIKGRKVATLKAGYAQGIRDLIPFVNGREPGAIAGQGKGKGFAVPARAGLWKCRALFANLIGAKWDTRDTATPKATPALQQAFEEEKRDMDVYIERKFRDSAHKAGIRTN